MLCNVWPRIGTGPVRYLAESWEILADKSKFPHQPLLDYLLAIPPNDWPEEVRVPYKDSAFAVACSFTCMYAFDENCSPLDVVRFWPIHNSVEYVELLISWHPGALIVLAHYCIVLQRVGMGCWYLEGRAVSMLSTIVRQLDPIWHRYIEWPLSEVGLSPSTERMTDESLLESLALSNNLSSSLHGDFDC